MQTDRPLDGVDSRFALTVYAAVMWPVGLFIALWGPSWIHGSLNGVPNGMNAVVRMVGVVIIAFACAATGAARISDPVDRWRCLAWLGHGHGVITVMAMLESFAIWPSRLGSPVLLALLVPTVWLSHSSQKRDGDGPTGILAQRRFRKIGDLRLRSAYEDSLRKSAVQEERARLARDLHDSIKQQLFVVQTSAATAQARLGTSLADANIALVQIRNSARDALTEMDTMLDQLRAVPLENAGLVSALQKLAEATSIRTGVDVRCEIGDLPAAELLPPSTHGEFLRIAQEALSNMARHARASHVALALRSDGAALTMQITDDGKGFEEDAKSRGMGLRNMNERVVQLGGTLAIESRPAHGTSIIASVPVARPSRRSYSWKLLSSIGLLVASVALVIADRANDHTRGGVTLGILPIAIASAFNLVRYWYAWRKSRRLSLTAA